MQIFVGTFNEQQLKDKEDKADIEKAIKETGLKYIKSRLVKIQGVQYMKVFLVDSIDKT